MNQRIKELAEQARKYSRDYVAECKHYGYYMEHNEYEVRFEEKFAELIVRECTNMLPTDSIRNEEGVHMFYVIRDHFGVSGIEGVR